MKLRYDFDSSQKTYRTFPQRMVQSTGLADRWSFLRWCCPFCLDKPKPRSRASSGVPVIRITRPRSPDSDQDSDEDVEWQRGGARDTDYTVRSPHGDGWTEPGMDEASVGSSVGSGELENIDEEYNDSRGDEIDTDSVRSRSSVKSKDSVKSKSSVTDSTKSKNSFKGKKGKDSKKNDRDSLKGSRDSFMDKESIKTRSPMKKIFKQLKRSASSGSTSSTDSRGNEDTRSSWSRRDDSKKGGTKRPSAPSDVRWRSMTMGSRGLRNKETETQRTSFSDGKSHTVKGDVRATLERRGRGGEVCYSDGCSQPTLNGGREGQEGPGSPQTLPREHSPIQESSNAEGRGGTVNSNPKNSQRHVDRNSISSSPLEEYTEVDKPLKTPARIEHAEKSLKDRVRGEEQDAGGRPTQVRSCPPDAPMQKHDIYETPAKQEQQQQPSCQESSSPTQDSPSPTPEDETSTGGEITTGGGGGGGSGDLSSTQHGGGGGGIGGGGSGGGGGQKSGSPSPLVGSVGRISGRDSVASLTSSTDTSCLTHPDEDIERLLQLNEKKISSLTPLGSRSESMASVCSAGAEGRYGTVIIRGEIELGLQYNYKEGQLEVHVAQCRDLAAVDTKRNRSDPYVKVYLLPDKSKSGKRKTKVKKHTLNPVFEEVLKFSTTMSELESRTLWVSVWHSDMFGRNDFLGEVVITLADTVFDDVSPKWYSLQDRMEPLEELSYSPRGDLILALKFVPPDAVSNKKTRRSRGALHVLVKEAKSLAAVRPHGTADPVCKGLLLPEKGKASKQKTSVCRKTLNPTWNHTLVFDDTSLQELTERALELSVWDHDRLGPSHFLGGCRLSLGKGKHGGRPVEWMEAAGMEVKLWEQMLDRPNLWVEGSIMLRPAMDKPIYSSCMTE